MNRHHHRAAMIIIAMIVWLMCHPASSRLHAASSGSSWPMWGGDSAHTNRSAANGPNTANLAWSSDIPIVSDVVVGPDGTIYGASYNPQEHSELFAIDPAAGAIKWRKPVPFGETIGTPAVGPDGTVYMSSGISTGTLSALDPADGSTRWTFDTQGSIRTALTIATDGTIYAGTDFSGPGALYAINPDGTLKWKWNTPAGGFEATAIAISPYNGDIIFRVTCAGCGIFALRNDGQLHWMTGGDEGNRVNSPAVGPDGTVYIGRRDYGFRAFDRDTGALKWRVDFANWIGSGAAAIATDGSTVYKGDNGGILYAVDSRGFIKWQFDATFDNPGIGTSGSAVLTANGLVYFTTDASTGTPDTAKGYLYALRAADGALVWRYEIGFSGASPAIGPDGSLYITGYTGALPGTYKLYAFRCADGSCAVPPPPNLVQDGSFEASPPNPSWHTQAASGSICNTTSCGASKAHTGTSWLQFGPTGGFISTYASQTGNIPAGMSSLSFWLAIPNTGTWASSDVLVVSIDRQPIFGAKGADAASYSHYKKVVLDIGAFADGAIHTISFETMLYGGGLALPSSSFLVDDVAIEGPTPIDGLKASASPIAAPAHRSINFQASISAGTNVSYTWTFGDGKNGSGQSIAHTYATPGLYTVTVKATNSLGSVSASTTVQISPSTGNDVFVPLVANAR